MKNKISSTAPLTIPLPSTEKDIFSKSVKFGIFRDKVVYLKFDGKEIRVADLSLAPDLEDPMFIYVERYLDLLDRISLWTQKAKLSLIKPSEVEPTLNEFKEEIEKFNYVGDAYRLYNELSKVELNKESIIEKITQEYEVKLNEAIKVRQNIIDSVKAIATKEYGIAKWKDAQTAIEEKFNEWNNEQRLGFKLDQELSDQLWSQLSSARRAFDKAKKNFFEELNKTRKTALGIKNDLIEKAVAIKDSKEFSETAAQFKELMNSWKKSPRLQPKKEQELWEKFKAAQDEFFSNKNKVEEEKFEEYKTHLDTKKKAVEMLKAIKFDNAEIAREKYREAKKLYDSTEWVPKKYTEKLEGEFPKVDKKIKDLETKIWDDSNPLKLKLQGDLQDALAKLNLK
jgi:ABC-type dipeptide/oligopeptide/nickel transport system ATPase component